MMEPVPAQRTMEYAACPLGCSGPDIFVLSARDRINRRPGIFEVVRCERCGLMRTNPRPTAASMAEFYPDDYGPYRGTQVPTNQNPFRRLLRSLYRRLLPTYANALPPVQPGEALEIGCASGAFLNELRARGWRCTGLEYSPSASEAARAWGHTVHCGSVDELPPEGAKFDLVVGWMVLEHLHHPVDALRRLASRSQPGGFLVLSVPNAGSPDFALFAGAGYALHLPNHLYHFTPETLEKTLLAGGWRLRRIFHHRTLSNWIGGLGNLLEDKALPAAVFAPLQAYPESFGLATLAAYPLAAVAALFGWSGRMTVWAERIEKDST